jgi:hypothetical protein
MNREDIIRMAREVGMQGILTDVVTTIYELERFAAIVANHEREACAKVCDEVECGSSMMIEERQTANECARKIRARGEVPR